MTKLKLLFIATLCIVVFHSMIGCETEVRQKSETVKAVYWHEGRSFSVAIRDGDKLRMVRLPHSHFDEVLKIDVLCDAPAGRPWYEYRYERSFWDSMHKGGWLKVHIPSVDELRTADWNHGKNGSGTTTRIDQ